MWVNDAAASHLLWYGQIIDYAFPLHMDPNEEIQYSTPQSMTSATSALS